MTTAADPIAIAADVRRFSTIITKMARQDLESHLARSGVGIRVLEHAVLRWLRERPHTLTELSQAMQAPPSTLVPIVDALEKKGLIIRGQDSRDRRRAPLSLTSQGKKLFATIPVMDQGSVMVRGLESLTANQRRQLHALLHLLVTRMTEYAAEAQDDHS